MISNQVSSSAKVAGKDWISTGVMSLMSNKNSINEIICKKSKKSIMWIE